MSDAKCSKCGQTRQTLFLRFGKQLCYPCFDEMSTGIPYVRDLEAEVARLRERIKELEAENAALKSGGYNVPAYNTCDQSGTVYLPPQLADTDKNKEAKP